MFSLESSIRTCKVDTAYANKVESDRFLNPSNMVCPIWNGVDTSGRTVCPDSFWTKRAGCNSAEDRVVVENNQRPQYMEYINLSASGIDGAMYGNNMPWTEAGKTNQILRDTNKITGNFGSQFGANVYPACGYYPYQQALNQVNQVNPPTKEGFTYQQDLYHQELKNHQELNQQELNQLVLNHQKELIQVNPPTKERMAPLMAFNFSKLTPATNNKGFISKIIAYITENQKNLLNSLRGRSFSLKVKNNNSLSIYYPYGFYNSNSGASVIYKFGKNNTLICDSGLSKFNNKCLAYEILPVNNYHKQGDVSIEGVYVGGVVGVPDCEAQTISHNIALKLNTKILYFNGNFIYYIGSDNVTYYLSTETYVNNLKSSIPFYKFLPDLSKAATIEIIKIY